MTIDLANRYAARVPRYTSYPTAPHFGPSIQGATYAGWLGELDPAKPLSLYFHIPFCAEMCSFCGCHTKIVRRYAPISRYLEALLGEAKLVGSALPGRFTAGFLHWGGGSPTMLTGDDWQRTLDHLRGLFDVMDNAEVAVELDPRTATEEYVTALARAGVTRVSVGVQDFDPIVQAAIRRVQPFETTARVIGWLRENGITAINLDLMYGLPHQTVGHVRSSIEKAVSLAPSRIALFGYAHVPWMKSHQKLIDETALPGAEERFAQAEAAASDLLAVGYRRIGLDHFAQEGDPLYAALKEGRLRRNFQGYTEDDTEALIGFGASSIGALPQGYVQNNPSLRKYASIVALGALPVHRGVALSDTDRLHREVIERLMCDLSVDLAAASERYGVPVRVFDQDRTRLASLEADGLVRIEGDRIAVTEAGRPFVRLAASAFDRYFSVNESRHAMAV